MLVRAVAEPEVEPDMGSPQALVGVADLLEERAAEEAGRHQLQSSIALRLLAMQILLAAFRQVGTSQLGEAKGTCPHAQATLQQQQQGEQATVTQPHRESDQHQQGQQQRPVPSAPGQTVTAGREFSLFSKQIKQRLLDMAGRVEDSLSALRQDGESTVVPYVWQVVYQAALAHAQTGATQEIIGGIRSCILSYSQVCCRPGRHCSDISTFFATVHMGLLLRFHGVVSPLPFVFTAVLMLDDLDHLPYRHAYL